jgi:sulfite reductase alpha subunit-like flavoprotein
MELNGLPFCYQKFLEINPYELGVINTMFGQTTSIGSATLSDSSNRMFRVEVEGMKQNVNTDRINYPIRNSGTVYLSVPYNRMSQQMQRINRMGGKIVSIEPLTVDGNSEAKKQATAEQQQLADEGQSESSDGEN